MSASSVSTTSSINSSATNVEPKTPAEYAFQILFTQFVSVAERKMTNVLSYSIDREPDLATLMGPGVDPAFDKLLRSLGYIARHKPKVVIDSVMVWRKSKSESNDNPLPKLSGDIMTQAARSKEAASVLVQRRSLVSIFILCRALIEIIKQVPADALGEDLSNKLEDTIFNQFKTADPEQIVKSANRQANLSLFAELMGWLADLRFTYVSDRFIGELEKTAKGFIPKEKEPQLEMLIRGMRCFKLKLYPIELFEEMADFLESLANFSVNAPTRLKYAYYDLFMGLMLPIAGSAYAELNLPAWSKTVEVIYAKTVSQLSKTRHWTIAYPMMTTLLCVSTKDFFTENWMPCVEQALVKMKDKANRPLAMSCITRLVWVHLYRCNESLNNTHKKLDAIMKALFPANRRTVFPPECPQTPFIHIIHFIGTRHHDFCIKNIILWLLFSDMLPSNQSSVQVHPENLSPERMMIALKAYLHILQDIESSANKPEFPASTDLHSATDFGSQYVYSNAIMPPIAFTRPGVREHHERICDIVGTIAQICDEVHAAATILDERYVQPTGSGGTVAAPNVAVLASSFGLSSAAAGKVGGLIGSASDREPAVTHVYGPFTVMYPRERQPWFDLMRIYIEALPRLKPSNLPLSKLIKMVSRATIHVDPSVSKAASETLLRLARQCGGEAVVTGFAKFMLKIEDRHSDVLAGGFSNNFDGLLKQYIELLNVWLEELRSKKQGDLSKLQQDSPIRNLSEPLGSPDNADMEFASAWRTIEETEGIGLLFLANESRIVRRYAISILNLARDFENVLNGTSEDAPRSSNPSPLPSPSIKSPPPTAGAQTFGNTLNSTALTLISSPPTYQTIEDRSIKSISVVSPTYSRVIQILEKGSKELLNFDTDSLSAGEKARLSKLQQQDSKDVLIRLAESDQRDESTIWLRSFPGFMKMCHSLFPVSIALCREHVCSRIVQLQPSINVIDSGVRSPTGPLPGKSGIGGSSGSLATPAALVEQWKAYLIVACSTLTLSDDNGLSQAQGTKKGRPAPERIVAARPLFKMIIPLLASDQSDIREAVVTGLGCTNWNLYRLLLDELSPHRSVLYEESKAMFNQSQQKGGAVRRSKKQDRLRIELAQVHQLTSHFLVEMEECIRDDKLLLDITTYIRETKYFLKDIEVQPAWEFQRLRRYYCGLIAKFYDGLAKWSRVDSFLGMDARLSLFRFLEDWCGYGQNAAATKERDARMLASVLDQFKDPRERGLQTAVIESERKSLEMASLNAMASLCAGPLTQTDSNGKVFSFDIIALFNWIYSIFSNTSDRLHKIGRMALRNVLVHNANTPSLLEDVVGECFSGEPATKSTQSFFITLCEIIQELAFYPFPMHQVLCLGLLKAGDRDLNIRRNAIRILKTVEDRFALDVGVQEFEIGISSDTKSVYKNAQTRLCERLARCGDELCYLSISEFVSRLNTKNEISRREIMDLLLPWLRNVRLQTEPNSNDLTLPSRMVLTNMVYMTIKSGDGYFKKIERIWHALVFDNDEPSLKLAVRYLLELAIEKRNPHLVVHIQKIVVYLGRTSLRTALCDQLISIIQPKAMVPQRQDDHDVAASKNDANLYIANLDDCLSVNQKRPVFSRGQLALVFMVQLVTEVGQAISEHLPLLLHVTFVQMGHPTAIVHEQARQMLAHLVWTLLVGKNTPDGHADSIVFLLDQINVKDGKRLWQNEDLNFSKLQFNRKLLKTPVAMEELIQAVIDVFSMHNMDCRQMWGEVSLTWATSCSVRHIACRSFQIFRTLMPQLSQRMLADMLARLSNTVADSSDDIQGFALEILSTLKVIGENIDPYELETFPQLFWVTMASLQTIHEQEYIEVLQMLQYLLPKLDLDDEENKDILLSSKPADWDGNFGGIQPLVLQGLRSATSYKLSLKLLRQLNATDDTLVDPSGARLMYLILANLPDMLHALEQEKIEGEVMEAAEQICIIADRESRSNVVRVLSSFAKSRFRTKQDFLRETISCLMDEFFPEFEAGALIFLLGMVSNKLSYVKSKTLEVLKNTISRIDTRKPDFTGIGAELISPLLRLLQTDYAQEALEVLDQAISISGGPMDKQILRMSLGQRTMRRDHETTATLFGIPDESGWSVPTPLATANRTRNNVHAVFYTCSVPTMSESPQAPNIHFSVDDYSFLGEGADMIDGMNGEDAADRRNDFNMMISALHDLDTFFTDEVEAESDDIGQQDDGLDIQDRGDDNRDISSRVATILSRTLERSPSVSSVKNHFNDSFAHAVGADRMQPMTPMSQAFTMSHATPLTSSPDNSEDEQEDVSSGDEFDLEIEAMQKELGNGIAPINSHSHTRSDSNLLSPEMKDSSKAYNGHSYPSSPSYLQAPMSKDTTFSKLMMRKRSTSPNPLSPPPSQPPPPVPPPE